MKTRTLFLAFTIISASLIITGMIHDAMCPKIIRVNS